MTHESPAYDLVRSTTLTDYFHHALHRAARQRAVRADDATLHYLTLLLVGYARSDRLFDFADRRLRIPPLALLYAEAQHATSERERRLWLQRLGDVALFIGGLFSGQLGRRFRSRQYCIDMGTSAYAYLYETADNDSRGTVDVFGQLVVEFERFVDIVAVVARPAPATSPSP
ncbi:MAG: hypothetical protein KDI88_02240 [Gammaproteobacteria bacterium]|nr:hypothetical protein [Gammaproteobacteria bacterium]